MSKKWKLDRRTLLKGFGTCIGLPFLEAMLPAKALAQESAKKHKFLLCYQPNGNFMNGSEDTNFPAHLNSPLSAINNDIARIRDMDFLGLYGQSDHYQIPMIIYTPGQTTPKPGDPSQHIIAGKSFDNIIAETVFPNHSHKHLAISLFDSSWVPTDRYNIFQSSRFSWLDQNTPNPTFHQPKELFEYLFAGFKPDQTAQQIAERNAYQKSILD